MAYVLQTHLLVVVSRALSMESAEQCEQLTLLVDAAPEHRGSEPS